MKWIERVNYALNYIEENLCEEIDYNKINRILLCPVEVLKRFFVLNTEMTLSDYIRKHKLNEAANTIRQTDKKIIDVAIEYGYQSSDSFCVAFKQLYGLTPRELRRSEIKFTPFPRIRFSLDVSHVQFDYIKEKGGNKMLFCGEAIDFKSCGNEFSAKKFDGKILIEFEKIKKEPSSIEIKSSCVKGDINASIQFADQPETKISSNCKIDLDNYDDGEYTITVNAKNAENIIVNYEFI